MSRRVLFCSQAAYRDGGVEAWLDALVDVLARDGWDVQVALAAGKFHNPAWYLERHSFPRAIALDGTRGLREGRFVKLLRTFESTAPDIIFPVGLADALYTAAEWKRRGANMRLVTCMHGSNAEQIRDIERCAPFIDLATSVSGRITSILRELPELGGRVRHIPTGVREPDAPPHARTNLRSVAYVGRLHDRDKRALDLIPFARALRGCGITLHIAGSGPDQESVATALAQDIEEGSVVLHGSISMADLYTKIYPVVDALILFSESEGGPIVAWEAMIHGVVPVVSDFAGRREEGVIRHEETGLVFPVGDVDSAVGEVLRLRDSALLQKLSEAAMRDLPDHYRRAGFEKNWREALTQVASETPVRSDRRLPRSVSPGLVARLNLSERASFLLRTIVHTSFDPEEPGAEWPHSYGGADPW